jgi:tRNA pseudouridine38-40 synthase
VAYDGTDFHGWQIQPGLRTVQGTVEAALDRLELEDRTRTAGAGRTDAGVHARGQVTSFSAVTRLPARALAPLLKRHLPPDVRVLEAAEVSAEFHARHSAVARRYAYRLLWREDLLWERFAWRPARIVAPDALERAVRVLEGEHDFAAFQASGGAPGRTVCRMMRAAWTRWDGGVRLEVIADHFLYHMVRNIVGTALAAAATDDPAGRLRALLASRDRGAGGVTAPACGLTLEQVFYAPEGRR